MLLRIILSLVLIIPTGVIIGRRVYWLLRLVRSGQPALGRTDGLGQRLGDQGREVFGQRSC